MKIVNTIILTLLFFTGVLHSEETKVNTFSEDGVSFNYPSDWEITEEENLNDIGYYLALEKKGYDSSGMVILLWFIGEDDLQESLNIYKESLQEQLVLKLGGIKFTEHYDNQFSGINTIATDYSFSTLGVKHQGSLQAFIKNNKTFTVVMQQAIAEKSENSPGFTMFEQSFKVE